MSMESLRGPMQHISHPIRVAGLDSTMILGCLPAIFFPFASQSWMIAGVNCLAIFISSQMNLPSNQIPRRLLSMLRPSVLTPTRNQLERSIKKTRPY